jgi:hypothetical protein
MLSETNDMTRGGAHQGKSFGVAPHGRASSSQGLSAWWEMPNLLDETLHDLGLVLVLETEGLILVRSSAGQ